MVPLIAKSEGSLVWTLMFKKEHLGDFVLLWWLHVTGVLAFASDGNTQ